MKIVLGIHSLAGSGGTETYTVTVGDHLQRTGHDVYIYSAEDGRTGDLARAHGLRVVTHTDELPPKLDAVLAQDRIASLELMASHPDAVHVYGWHSELFDVQLPPQIEDAVALNVVLHADAFRRIRSLAVKTPVLQLTHPVDVMRFQPLAELRERPRKVIALGNYLNGSLKTKLEDACVIAGLEFSHVGLHGEGVTDTPELTINEADIVVGKARVVLEAMSCGRAAFVYDVFGADGWVTPQNYQQLEATCFAGTALDREFTSDSLATELLKFDSQMGIDNRALILAKHNAMTHTGQLVEAIENLLGVGTRAMDHDAASELARMARVNWRHEQKAYELSYNLREQSRKQQWTEDVLEYTRARLELETERADQATEEARRIDGSLRWRVMSRVAQPFDRARGRS